MNGPYDDDNPWAGLGYDDEVRVRGLWHQDGAFPHEADDSPNWRSMQWDPEVRRRLHG